MAEIKSAIELAMEKTKSLVMDEQERRNFAEKEAENKVRVLLRRFREGLADLGDTRDAFQEIRVDDRAKRAVLVDVVTREFDILDRDKVFVDLLDSVCGLPEAIRDELKVIRKRYEEELERRAMIFRERLRDELKVQGLSGTALELNLEGWDPWQQEARETKGAFERRIIDWKKAVEQSCGRHGTP
jgi:hypothetical protein